MKDISIEKERKGNPQIGNVGNRGDILKHAMLVSLLELTIKKSTKEIAYIDTHTFMLSAPCPKPDEWSEEVSVLLNDFNDYKYYYSLEQHVLKQQFYRCSAGLALDILNGSGRTYCAYLGEKDLQTRTELMQQIKRERQTHCNVLLEAEEIENLQLPAGVFTVLMHVDPFELNDSLWKSICIAIGNFTKLGIDVIVQVFTYSKDSASMQWPEAPLPVRHPTAALSRSPYHLAIYSSESMIDEIKQNGQELGWEV